jgi:hypothetical protein
MSRAEVMILNRKIWACVAPDSMAVTRIRTYFDLDSEAYNRAITRWTVHGRHPESRRRRPVLPGECR